MNISALLADRLHVVEHTGRAELIQACPKHRRTSEATGSRPGRHPDRHQPNYEGIILE